MEMPEVAWLYYDHDMDRLVVVGEGEEYNAVSYVPQSVANAEQDRLLDRLMHYKAQADNAMAKLAELGRDLNVGSQ